MKNKKTVILSIIVCLLLSITIYLAYILNSSKTSEVIVEDEPVINDIVEINYDEYIKKWNSYNNINNDYIGVIAFESGLIDLPFVQADNNDKYLRTNWETMEYDIYGSIFADYECNLDSQNYILYGHHVDINFNPDGQDLMFCPLQKLYNKENYDDNKIVKLILEDRVRTYEVVSVFNCNLFKEGETWVPNSSLIYYIPDYKADYFSIYKNAIKTNEEYDTGVDFDYSDNFLTLQTCVQGREDLREIVLCKQINEQFY